MAIDFYAGKHDLSFKSKFNGLYSKQIINNETVIVLKPQTFMNLSGECVREFVNYFDIDLDDVLIIHDDVDFEIGTFKVKVKGSSGGHNGMKNILENLKVESINRIKEDLDKLNGCLPIISEAIDDFISHDINYVMTKYNGINKDE